MGDRQIALIEVASEPSFYYTTCYQQTQSDVDVHVTLMTKGSVETAKRQLYIITDLVKGALLKDQKISDTCLGSTIEQVLYGEYGDAANKQMIAASQITVRCRL